MQAGYVSAKCLGGVLAIDSKDATIHKLHKQLKMTTLSRVSLPGEPATHAESNARCWLETIVSHWDAYRWADSESSTVIGLHPDTYTLLAENGLQTDEDGCYDWQTIKDSIMQRVSELPLCVEVRTGWLDLNADVWSDGTVQPDEYRICLTFGGPSLVLQGDIGTGTPRLIFAEMGLEPTELRTSSAEDYALDWFVGQFYFGS